MSKVRVINRVGLTPDGKPLCRERCGRICKRYKPTYKNAPPFAYSASCKKCAEKHATWLRGNRAKLKRERGYSQLRYKP